MTDEGVSGKTSDQISATKKYTRREFLKLGTLAAAGAALPACTSIPVPLETEESSPPTPEPGSPPEAIAPPTRSSEPSSPEPPPTTESEIPPSDFSPEPTVQSTPEPPTEPTPEISSRSTPDQVVEIGGRTIEILCFNNPIKSAQELEDLRKEISANVEISEIDPKKRGLELCVSKQAWEMWKDTQNPDHPMNGEELLPFIVRHLDELNKILDNSNLPDVETYLKRVIIWDEVGEDRVDSDLVGNYNQLQCSSSIDVFGSWEINSHHIAKRSDFLHNNWDDGLLHELSHYFLYNMNHLSEYYNPNYENFLPEGQGRLKAPQHLLNFTVLDQQISEPFDNCLLDYAHENPQNTRYSQIESLYFLRAIQESNEMKKEGSRELSLLPVVNDRLTQDILIRGEDLAPGYAFFIPQETFGQGNHHVKIYEAGVYDRSAYAGQIHWQINETPFREIDVEEGKPLTLDRELLKGGAKVVGTDEQVGIAKLFIMEVEGANGTKKNYAFTTWHLAGWNWREQKKQAKGEVILGIKGPEVIPAISLPA